MYQDATSVVRVKYMVTHFASRLFSDFDKARDDVVETSVLRNWGWLPVNIPQSDNPEERRNWTLPMLIKMRLKVGFFQLGLQMRPWLQSCERLKQKSELSTPRLLTYRICEIIKMCCLNYYILATCYAATDDKGDLNIH